MGCFDTVSVWDDYNELGIVCAGGHRIQDSWQTKDLGQTMKRFHIFKKRLFEEFGRPLSAMLEIKGMPDVGVFNVERRCPFLSKTCEIHIYTHCSVCDQVVYREPRARWSYHDIGGRSPWVEYRLKIVDGTVVQVTPIKVESRDDVRNDLRLNGLVVLDDGDRHVRKYLEDERERMEWADEG